MKTSLKPPTPPPPGAPHYAHLANFKTTYLAAECLLVCQTFTSIIFLFEKSKMLR